MARAIGIYMGRREVIGASVTMSRGVPALAEFAIEPIEAAAPRKTVESKKQKSLLSLFQKAAAKDLSPESQAVSRLCQKLHAGGTRVIAAFNPFHVVTRYFEIPYVPPEEWPHVIRYEANRYVPFKMTETVSDYSAVEQTKADGKKVLAATISATKVQTLRQFVRQLRDGGVKVDMVEPVYLAFSRALAAGEKLDDRKTYGFIFIDADGSVNLTFARGKSVYLSRDFLLSENQRESQTRFYEEFTASLNFLGRSAAVEQVEKVFLAGSGDLIFWTDFLANTFRQEIQFEFGLFPTKQNISRNVLAALLVPIGSALRKLGAKAPLGELSLLPEEERVTQPERVQRVLIRQTLVLILLFMGVRFAILQPYLMYLEKKHRAHESRSIQLDPQLSRLPVNELEAVRDDLNKQVRDLNAIFKNKVLFGKKLEALARSIPEPIWLESITYGAAGFDLSGQGEGFSWSGGGSKGLTIGGWASAGSAEEEVKAVNEWINGLDKNGTFMEGLRDVKLEEIRREQQQGKEMSRFQVTCT